MMECRLVDTPMDANVKLNNKDDDQPVDKGRQYQRLVGKLIYLAHTRPDIAFTELRESIHAFVFQKSS